jgi:hypothetical protein
MLLKDFLCETTTMVGVLCVSLSVAGFCYLYKNTFNDMNKGAKETTGYNREVEDKLKDLTSKVEGTERMCKRTLSDIKDVEGVLTPQTFRNSVLSRDYTDISAEFIEISTRLSYLTDNFTTKMPDICVYSPATSSLLA